jgi:hypothetical protein
MLSAYLVRMIENHAEELTRELLNDLMANARTPSYHRLSADELHRRTYDLYHNLGQWLADKSESAIEAMYVQLGSTRSAEGVPASELIYALVLAKEHLRNFVRRVGVVYSALELHREVELNLMIGHFFDRAMYYAIRGHEAARHLSHEPKTPAVRQAARG